MWSLFCPSIGIIIRMRLVLFFSRVNGPLSFWIIDASYLKRVWFADIWLLFCDVPSADAHHKVSQWHLEHDFWNSRDVSSLLTELLWWLAFFYMPLHDLTFVLLSLFWELSELLFEARLLLGPVAVSVSIKNIIFADFEGCYWFKVVIILFR